MKITSLLLPIFLLVVTAKAQVPASVQLKADSVVAEGKRLFRSEMASWHGTDLFMEQGGDRDRIGGYFSYLSGGQTKFVMVSNEEDPVAICTITFDSTGY